jgi:hypothetical protein
MPWGLPNRRKVFYYMDMKTFRPYDPEQLLLLPPAIQDWLP